ncbi:MAG: hypothetical protein ABJ308_08600 [Halieaceae bacterium]
MSDHNKRVEPASFEPAAAPATEAPGPKTEPRQRVLKGAGQPNWVVPALATLAVLALLVFFWLPSQVDTGTVAIDPATVAATRSKPASIDVSPWSDAQLARQRKDAQEILAALLDEQFTLEEMSVELWAGEAFGSAQALAATGDEQYRQQEFLTAGETYQQALDAMLEIKASVDSVFADTLQRGLDALRSDQAKAALEALQLAIVLKPDDPSAQAALTRAQNLEPLLALLQQANDARDTGALENALGLLQQAVALDPEHPGASVQLASVEREIARRNFNQAMTAGYQALDEGRFDEAERQFTAAQRILPAAGETESALVQTRSARTRAQIDAYGQRAQAAAEREDWNQAVAAYQQILKIDKSVVFARAGLIQSKARAQLDNRLKKALSKPERLGDDKVYRDTRALYQQALALEQKGPLLREQLAQLDQALELAIVPIPVLLQSDEQTDVTVYKVSHLGSFRRRQLSLKPGVYTAVGVRSGFRDVRRKFTVNPGQTNNVVEISCTEPI